MGLRSASIDIVYSEGYEKIFEAIKNALLDNKFIIKSSDKGNGQINASAKMSILSWGENINISIIKVENKKTRVSIYSGTKFGAWDWGKSNKNISLLKDSINKRINMEK